MGTPIKHVLNIGDRFGRLTIVAVGPKGSGSRRRWVCRCDCGKEKVVASEPLYAGRQTSCGCLASELTRAMNAMRTTVAKRKRHGRATPTYSVYTSMKQRCLNPRNTAYRFYGGKGVRICERWLESFDNFLADMGERPGGLELDRIDSSKGYEPGNCRWVNDQVQGRNRSSVRLTAEIRSEIDVLLAQGVPKSAIAASFGVSRTAIDKYSRGLTWAGAQVLGGA